MRVVASTSNMDTSRPVRILSEDLRFPLHKRQLTSCMSTATDYTPRLTPTSHSRSRTEKSAERIASYVTAYTHENLTERSRKSSKGTITMQRTICDVHVEALPSMSKGKTVEEEKRAKEKIECHLRSLWKQVEELRNEVSVAMSDKLDLLRDLACFECYFGKQVRLQDRLSHVHTTASSLPDLTSSFSTVSYGSSQILSTLRVSFTHLSALRTRSPRVSSRLRKTKTGLREINTRHHIKNQFQSCDTISSVRVMIQVSADEALEHFRINVETLTGGKFDITFTHDLFQDFDPPREAIRKRLLPHLHFVSLNHSIVLHFDPHHGSTFTTVITHVKGLKEAMCLVLTMDEDCVNVRSEDFDCLLSVPLVNFTDKRSVFLLTSTEIARIFRKRLAFRAAVSQFIWLDQENALFSQKEKLSKLMDADFLSEALGNFVLILMSKEDVMIDGQRFTVELYAHRSVEKVRIVREDRYVDLQPGSRTLKVLKALQFGLLQKAPNTVAKSLELMHCIRTLFVNKT